MRTFTSSSQIEPTRELAKSNGTAVTSKQVALGTACVRVNCQQLNDS